ncbi:hypothetical protein HZS_1702, partial [Henneguya salminicola]
MGKLQKSKNHQESEIKYGFKDNVIYILTYQKSEDGSINDSTLYSSLLTDISFTPIELLYEGLNFPFTKIEVGPKIIVGISDIKNLLAISTNLGRDWEISYRKIGGVKEIAISSQNSRHIAIVSNRNKVYLLENFGGQINFITHYGTKLMWSLNSEFLYFLFSKTVSRHILESEFEDRIFLKKTNNYLDEPETVLAGAIDFGKTGDIIWAVTTDIHKAYLHIIGSDGEVKKTHFPEFLKPNKFYSFSSKNQIYTIVKNETNGILLYSASLNDLRFTRIGETILSSYNFSIEPCIPVETFDSLPGVLIMNKETTIEDQLKIFTAISYNYGLKWTNIVPPKIIKDFPCIWYGEFIITFSFSYDLGHTWKYSTLEGNSLIPIKIFPDSSSSSLLTTIITLNNNTKEWGFIKIDFTKTLSKKYMLKLIEKDCHSNDYEIYTPGLHDKSACFQGQKRFTYRRRQAVKCKSLLDKLPRIMADLCPCTQDDFGCTYGHYFINGQCLKDLDDNENEILSTCVPGEFSVRLSKTKKIEGDICKSNEKWSDQELDICKFTLQDNSISVLIGSTIKYTYADGYGKQELINLPIDLTHVGYIKSYCVNFHLRCLYVLNGTGILQFCYNKKEFAYEHSEEIFLKDYSTLGMRLDQTSNNIFYYGPKNISIINEISKYSKVLYTSHVILYAYINTDLVPNKYCVNFLSMKGESKSNLCYDVRINAVTHDEENKIYVIYMKDSVSKVNYNYELVEKKVAATQYILEAYVNGNLEYFIKKNGIFFGNNALYNNHITYGHFHFVPKTEEKVPCILAHCDIFCLTTSPISYECDCPNNMVFDKTLFKCVCDASHPDCKACKSNEHHCENQKCVPMSNRCNRVDDCGDASDEKNCKITCEIDKLLCDNDSLCVGNSDICDGVNNCQDKKDELNCHKVSKCYSNQHRCLNGDCIPVSKYCNGIKDCPDYSDEESCQPGCKYFEARCNNGQCVRKNQICDNNFDCADLSDEHGCDTIVDVTRNLSCFIKCDNKCIPHDKVCNHITDCSDGTDELDCSNFSQLNKENKAFCSSKDMFHCNSDIICYELFKKCDGFKDCLDGIDEVNCKKTDLCSKSNKFECASMEKCISINDHCDGKYDCPDGSDEGQDCAHKKFIKTIKIKSMQDGNLELLLVPTKKSMKENYYVSVIARQITSIVDL